MLEKAPQSIRDAFSNREPELPKVFQNSTFYPLLEKIGDRLRSGEDLGKIADEINKL